MLNNDNTILIRRTGKLADELAIKGVIAYKLRKFDNRKKMNLLSLFAART